MVHGLDSLYDLRVWHGLREVAADAAGFGALVVGFADEGGEPDDAGVRVFCQDAGGGFEAFTRMHGDIYEQNVGAQLPE